MGSSNTVYILAESGAIVHTGGYDAIIIFVDLITVAGGKIVYKGILIRQVSCRHNGLEI